MRRDITVKRDIAISRKYIPAIVKTDGKSNYLTETDVVFGTIEEAEEWIDSAANGCSWAIKFWDEELA
jgi:hypothetical protein